MKRVLLFFMYGSIAAMSSVFVVGCEDDEVSSHQSEINPHEETTGPYGALTVVGESYFLSVLESLETPTHTLANAIETDAMMIHTRKNKLYAFPNPYTGASNVYVYRLDQQNSLVEEGRITVPAASGAGDILFINDTKAYISLSELGQIWQMNMRTLTKTATIDLTQYAIDDGDGDNSPNPTNMAMKDGKLYATLSQSYNSMMMGRNGMYVAVINIETNTVEKIIEETARGFAFAGRIGATGNATFVDEYGDLYVSAIGSWGWAPGQKAGFLRIKAGETEFDSDWEIDFANHPLTINDQQVTNNYLHYCTYAGNGIVYGSAHIPEHESNPPDWVNDKNYSIVKVDLYNRTVEAMPLPATTGYGSAMIMERDLLVAPMSTTKGGGIYLFDTVSGTPVTTPSITTEGIVSVMRPLSR